MVARQHQIAFMHEDARRATVARDETVAVIDFYCISVAAFLPREDDASAGCGKNRRVARRDQIDARMETRHHLKFGSLRTGRTRMSHHATPHSSHNQMTQTLAQLVRRTRHRCAQFVVDQPLAC
jgi:hypothetical protein